MWTRSANLHTGQRRERLQQKAGHTTAPDHIPYRPNPCLHQRGRPHTNLHRRPPMAASPTPSTGAASAPTPFSVIATLNLPLIAVIESCIALACAKAASMEVTMGVFAALDVSQEETAVWSAPHFTGQFGWG